MATSLINNDIYEALGDRWYTAYDDPIALLRAENEAKIPWMLSRILRNSPAANKVLDVGCGGGFLTNRLAREGFSVVGIDASPLSLQVAARHDSTGQVKYVEGDAYSLPFADQSFDIVTNMDFLEHVERPEDVIRECGRVLKPGGLFFFHTFNRNPLAHLIVIKLVEGFVRNTPENMHVIDLFIRPEEMVGYCQAAGMEVMELTGLRPDFATIPLKNLLSGIVPEGLRFQETKSLQLSYIGMARKD